MAAVVLCRPVEPARAGGAAKPLSDERAADRPAFSFLVAITGNRSGPQPEKMEPAVVVVPNGRTTTELRSVSPGRDLNTPTSRRVRRALSPITVHAPARRLDQVLAAAVVVVPTGSDCSTTELPERERSGQGSNLRPFANRR